MHFCSKAEDGSSFVIPEVEERSFEIKKASLSYGAGAGDKRVDVTEQLKFVSRYKTKYRLLPF